MSFVYYNFKEKKRLKKLRANEFEWTDNQFINPKSYCHNETFYSLINKLGYVEIDENIAYYIEMINQLGIETRMCCSGHYNKDYINVWISYNDEKEYDKNIFNEFLDSMKRLNMVQSIDKPCIYVFNNHNNSYLNVLTFYCDMFKEAIRLKEKYNLDDFKEVEIDVIINGIEKDEVVKENVF